MPHARDLRKGRFSEAHRIYLCTTVVRDRRPIFSDWRMGRQVIDALRWLDSLGATRTVVYVVMPDHLHWMFGLGTTLSLPQVIASVKKRSARTINACIGSNGSLWQAGYHDHAVRTDENLKGLAYYVVMNPVRARLVGSIREYSLWDAMWL